MDVYFVRHGQTDGNVARRHQHPSVPLNELGKLQAKRVSRILARNKPTHLITSTHKRAIETARYIGEAINVIPETHPAFEELKRPDFLVGRHLFDWEGIKFAVAWLLGVKSASMHDGESYDDFLQRLSNARSYLAQIPDNSKVVVVSHAVFINFFLEHMNRHHKMGIRRAVIRFIKLFMLKNTDVIHVRLQNGHWYVVEHL